MAEDNSAQDTLAGGNADDGAAAGDGQDKGHQEFVPPKDGSWLPKARFDEATGALKDRIRDLEARIEETNKKPADQPKRYTRAELNALVEARQITQEQADATVDEQIRREARDESRQVATETVIGITRKERVNSELAQYKRLAPEILQDASDTRARIVEEYNYFVATLGDPRTVETELKAIRSVLGPVEKLATARSGKSAGDTHRETGGGESGDRGGKKTGKLVDTLTPREKGYYENMIRQGHYKDWKDVETLLSSNRKRGAA